MKNKYFGLPILLFIVIGIAGVLRLVNPFYAHPILYVIGDEPPNYMGAFYILVNKSLTVRTAIYPPFGSYFQVPFLLVTFAIMLALKLIGSLAELQLLVVTQPGYFLFVPRILAGLLSTLTILVFYKIIELLLPKKTALALVSCLFLTFSFNHIQVSHFGRPWAATLFFFALSMFYSLNSIYSKIREVRQVILASIFAIMAYGFHQIGIFAVWFFILARCLPVKTTLSFALKNKITWFGLTICISGIGGVYLLQRGNPTADWFPIPTILSENYSLLARILALIINSNLLYNIRQLFYLEPVIFLLAFGYPFIHFRQTYRLLPLTIFTYTVGLALSLFFKQPRYLLPVIMPMCLFAAITLFQLIKQLQIRTLRLVTILLILFLASVNTVFWLTLFLKPPTSTLAIQWFTQHASPQDIILSSTDRWIPYVPAQSVLPFQQQKNPQFYYALSQLLEKNSYPPNVRNIIYLSEVIDFSSPETIQAGLKGFPIPYRFIVDYYFSPNRRIEPYIDPKLHRKVISFSPLIKKESIFLLDNILATVNYTPLPLLLPLLERSGPYIDIYERVL